MKHSHRGNPWTLLGAEPPPGLAGPGGGHTSHFLILKVPPSGVVPEREYLDHVAEPLCRTSLPEPPGTFPSSSSCALPEVSVPPA